MGQGPVDRADVPSEAEQVRARLSADEFALVYERHYGDVYRYVLSLTRSHAEAEDVSSETFERAYRSWTSGPVTHERALPWLLLTARRIATDRWRRLKRFAVIGRRSDTAARTDASHTQTEFWLWFDALTHALPERQREVLVLRYRRDLSDREIGTIMGLSESGVRSLVSRAIASLRDHPELLA